MTWCHAFMFACAGFCIAGALAVKLLRAKERRGAGQPPRF